MRKQISKFNDWQQTTDPRTSEKPRQAKIKKNTLRHIIVKLLKSSDKDKNLEDSKEKKTTNRRPKIRMSTDFSSKTMLPRRRENNVLKYLNRKQIM